MSTLFSHTAPEAIAKGPPANVACGCCGGQISPGSTTRLEDLAKGSGPNVSKGHPFVGLGGTLGEMDQHKIGST
jgi:PHP family Zn ribbon phosphoesterase